MGNSTSKNPYTRNLALRLRDRARTHKVKATCCFKIEIEFGYHMSGNAKKRIYKAMKEELSKTIPMHVERTVAGIPRLPEMIVVVVVARKGYMATLRATCVISEDHTFSQTFRRIAL